jgi:AcrR family transcriptional regulator
MTPASCIANVCWVVEGAPKFDVALRSAQNGHVEHPEPVETLSTRHRILQIALSLMSQRGVDGTSMRDLAAAAGLNVASLYHYFPSKRDLLEAVLVEHGYLPMVPDPSPLSAEQAPDTKLVGLLSEMLVAMLDVEDFVRLMLGEAIRGEETARAVGLDLFANFQHSLETWLVENRPDLDAGSGAPQVARLLRAMIVGIFVEHASGVMSAEGSDTAALMVTRAEEAAQILDPARRPEKAPPEATRTDPKEPVAGA